MSTKRIPEKVEVYCDVCNSLCGPGGKRRTMGGHIRIKRDALDYQGSPVADGSVDFDACDSCLETVSKAINAAAEAIRAAGHVPESRNG